MSVGFRGDLCACIWHPIYVVVYTCIPSHEDGTKSPCCIGKQERERIAPTPDSPVRDRYHRLPFPSEIPGRRDWVHVMVWHEAIHHLANRSTLGNAKPPAVNLSQDAVIESGVMVQALK